MYLLLLQHGQDLLRQFLRIHSYRQFVKIVRLADRLRLRLNLVEVPVHLVGNILEEFVLTLGRKLRALENLHFAGFGEASYVVRGAGDLGFGLGWLHEDIVSQIVVRAKTVSIAIVGQLRRFYRRRTQAGLTQNLGMVPFCLVSGRFSADATFTFVQLSLIVILWLGQSLDEHESVGARSHPVAAELLLRKTDLALLEYVRAFVDSGGLFGALGWSLRFPTQHWVELHLLVAGEHPLWPLVVWRQRACDRELAERITLAGVHPSGRPVIHMHACPHFYC